MIIFDLDGTLHRTEVPVIAAVERAARELKLEIPDEELIKAKIGEPGSQFARQLFPDSTEAIQHEFRRCYKHWESEMIPKLAALYDGVPDMLRELTARGFSLAICSNGGRKYVDSVLAATGIAGRFAYISGHEPERSKPQALAELLKLAAGSRAVFVGDRASDLRSARENHLPMIAALWGYGEVGELDGAAFRAREPAALLGHLLRWRVFSRVEKLIAERRARRPLVVGVSGIDTAGKTRFTHGLAPHLKARGFHTALIHLDDFHRPRANRQRGTDQVAAYYDHAFNFELLTAEILQPLRDEHRLDKRLRLLDVDTDKLTIERQWRIEPRTVVLLEGTLLLRPPLMEYIDLAVHLEISFDEMLSRAVVRDQPRFGENVVQRYREKYIPIQQRYLRDQRPRDHADIVINNENPDDPQVVGQQTIHS